MQSKMFRVITLLMILVWSLALIPVGAQDEDEDHMHGDGELDAETTHLISEVRGATAKYHDLDTALEEGYGEFLNCFTFADESAMGQHYVNGDLVGDDVVDPLQPEALVYEPHEDGTMVLVGFEYLVFADVWDPDGTGREAPTLFGQEFHLAENVPETPPVWALHFWLWTHNPDGLFADFNPTVFCLDDEPVVDMSQQ